MGVPVISLASSTHASRVTASILHRLNLSGMAAKTVGEFAQRARELSEMEETLVQLRTSLRNRMRESALMNVKQFGYEFGNTLRAQWRDWCNQSQAPIAAEPVPEIDENDALAGLEGLTE